MAAQELTAEDVADWLTPRQAVEILNASYGDNYLSKHALLERLRGGMVEAVACHTALGDKGNVARDSFLKIPAKPWDGIETNDSVWLTGDLRHSQRASSGMGFVTYRHFDVRFDPASVKAIVVHQSAPTTGGGKVAPEGAQEDKQPPVALAHLQAWFDFYKKIGGEMREDPAHAHARLCFPKNSIGRQKIRDLLGPRPMGRPKKTET
jgi:hypothetical protein